MVFSVEISETFNSVILIFSGAIIGSLLQPIGYILKSKYDDKHEKDNRIKDTAKKIYLQTIFYMDKIINLLTQIDEDSQFYSDMNYEGAADSIQTFIHYLNDNIENFKDFRLSIDAVKDMIIKESIDILIKHCITMKSMISLNDIAFNDHDTDKFNEDFDKLKEIYKKFKTDTYDKF